jgi:aspartyl-tRNA(Asn)/glutamyl-tRNA(Gln) amidotransferase subunit C
MSKKISEEELSKIANLSKLKLDSSKIDEFSQSLGDILSYISSIEDIDVSEIDKFFQVNDSSNILREDEEKKSSDFSLDTSNFIDTKDKYIKVKKIL